MKFATFYFSGTGNTEWVVKEFNQKIKEKGHLGEMFSIEQRDIQKLSFLEAIFRGSDYIGFANPIYGANIPPIMRNFIKLVVLLIAKDKEYSKPVYIINTFAYINGFGPFALNKLFSNVGLKLISYVNIKLCNNISTPKIKIDEISFEELEKRKEKALIQLDKMVDMLFTDKKYITGIGLYLIPGIIIRKKLHKGILDNYKALSVKNESCSLCMLCVNKCPTKSILYLDNSFEFLSTCTACMRCYNHCPSYSILFNGIYADPSIYKRYQGPEMIKK